MYIYLIYAYLLKRYMAEVLINPKLRYVGAAIYYSLHASIAFLVARNLGCTLPASLLARNLPSLTSSSVPPASCAQSWLYAVSVGHVNRVDVATIRQISKRP